MNKLMVAVLCGLAILGAAFGQTPAPKASVSQILMQQEHNWIDAVKSGDAAKLAEVMAEDWVTLGSDGSRITRQEYMADVKSGAEHIDSFEFGPMDVKVVGNVAIVQGSDRQKSSYKGKDTSGKWVWMDVFALRGGKWLAVRSQMTLVQPRGFAPTMHISLVEQGDFHLGRGEYDEAIHSYQQASKADPGNAATRKKLDEAITKCKQENSILNESMKCGAQ